MMAKPAMTPCTIARLSQNGSDHFHSSPMRIPNASVAAPSRRRVTSTCVHSSPDRHSSVNPTKILSGRYFHLQKFRLDVLDQVFELVCSIVAAAIDEESRRTVDPAADASQEIGPDLERGFTSFQSRSQLRGGQPQHPPQLEE